LEGGRGESLVYSGIGGGHLRLKLFERKCIIGFLGEKKGVLHYNTKKGCS